MLKKEKPHETLIIHKTHSDPGHCTWGFFNPSLEVQRLLDTGASRGLEYFIFDILFRKYVGHVGWNHKRVEGPHSNLCMEIDLFL